MDVGGAGERMAAAIAEGVELLDITQPQPGLFLHPGTQADFEGAMRDGVERAERQAGEFVAVMARRNQNQRFVALDRDDGRGQSDLDRGQRLFAH